MIRKLPENSSTKDIDGLVLNIYDHLMIKNKSGSSHGSSVFSDRCPLLTSDVIHVEITLKNKKSSMLVLKMSINHSYTELGPEEITLSH